MEGTGTMTETVRHREAHTQKTQKSRYAHKETTKWLDEKEQYQNRRDTLWRRQYTIK